MGDHVQFPSDCSIMTAYPNPFNPSTAISYQLQAAGQVKLTVYDICGREIVTLVNEFKLAGIHQAIFEGNDLSSGVYFARLITGNSIEIEKILLLR